MVLDSNQLRDVTRLKDAANEMVNNRWIPNGAAKKLRELLADETLDPKQFTQELQKIVKTAEGFNWDRLSSKIQPQVEHFFGIPFFGVLLVFFLIFVFRKRLFSKKTRTKFAPLFQNLGNRVIAVLAYSLFIFSLWAHFGELVGKNFQILDGLCPEFIKVGANLYRDNGFFIQITYILLLVQFCIKRNVPKPRILRFHFLQGFLFLMFQNYPSLLLDIVTQPLYQSTASLSSLRNGLYNLEFLLNLYFVLTALYQAVTLSYPKNKFLREAIEISLGPDEEGPDGTPFKWWDRQ